MGIVERNKSASLNNVSQWMIDATPGVAGKE
jgi:hypothetical protein